MIDETSDMTVTEKLIVYDKALDLRKKKRKSCKNVYKKYVCDSAHKSLEIKKMGSNHLKFENFSRAGDSPGWVASQVTAFLGNTLQALNGITLSYHFSP